MLVFDPCVVILPVSGEQMANVSRTNIAFHVMTVSRISFFPYARIGAEIVHICLGFVERLHVLLVLTKQSFILCFDKQIVHAFAIRRLILLSARMLFEI